MKSIFRAPAAILISSVVLFACSNGSNNTEDQPASIVSGDMKIGYINTDTLLAKYDKLKDLEEQLLNEKNALEAKFRGSYEQYEKNVRDAEEGAHMLSQEALQILQYNLAQQEQTLMQEKQILENQLLQSEAAKNDEYYKVIHDFLDRFAKRNGYHMIYGYNGFGNVLYMDQQFDVTNIIIDSLNQQYALTKEEVTPIP